MEHETRAAVGTGPDATFEELYQREREPMLRLAVLMVGSRALAEEIVQDSFLTVEQRWSGLDRPGGYLRSVVVNGCRMANRRRTLERRHAEVEPAQTIETELVELHAAIADLRPRHREAIVLRYFLDLSDPEIAHLLGCRPSTVRSLVHRGLARLRKDLR